MAVTLKRKTVQFCPDHRRVIARFFLPGDENRARAIIERVLALTGKEQMLIFNHVFRQFSGRHRNLTRVFEENFKRVEHLLDTLTVKGETLSKEIQHVIGAYFTKEYSIESAAFFNPSIVEDPYQGSLQENQKRVILSFRATGEGHVSSLVFRSAIVDEHNDFHIDPVGDSVDVPEIITRHEYDKRRFLAKLTEMHIKDDVISLVMDPLGDRFNYGQLQGAIAHTLKHQNLTHARRTVVQAINWLARSHYEVTFSWDTAICDRVLFPISFAESNGIEDARFVQFVEEDHAVTYYATYTAYDGYAILPKLIATTDFYHFKIMPIHGENVQNKGLALFPRRIKGKYAMLSRMDGINNYLMLSEEVTLWNSARRILGPQHPWEFVQVGNAGSPIETKHGWLVITHGVGPMRTYSLGAMLLDLDDPTQVVAHLKRPLLVANEKEREGYVPNVVYSCGSIIHNNELIIPYAMSDYASTVVCVPLDELFDELLGTGKR